MPLENVQISDLKARFLIYLRLLFVIVDTGQNGAKNTKNIFRRVTRPILQNFTILLTIMVAGWDVRLLTSNFCSVFIKSHKICVISIKLAVSAASQQLV